MKYLKYFLMLLLFPVIVSAKINDLEVVSVEMLEKSDNVLTVEEPIVNGSSLDLNNRFYEVDDYIQYRIVMNNVSDEDIVVTSDYDELLTKYFSYEVVLNSEDKILSNQQVELTLTIKYYEKVNEDDIVSGHYTESQKINIGMVNGQIIVSEDEIVDVDLPINPITKDAIIIFFIIAFIAAISLIIFHNKKIVKYSLVLLLFIPLYISAVDSVSVTSTVEIKLVKPNDCTYEGELVDGAVYEKEQYGYIYMADKEGWRLSLKDRDSTDPVTSKICTTVNGKPIVSMSGTFAGSKASSIDLSSFDTSHVTDMTAMFHNVLNINELDFITFDVRKVENMTAMFYNNNIEEYDFSRFETPSLRSISAMLANNKNIVELDLSNWDTSNVRDMGNFIGNTPNLKKLNISNWDFESFDVAGKFPNLLGSTISNITDLIADNVNWGSNMEAVFLNLNNVENISLKDIDTSKVTTMKSAFNGLYKIKELDLSDWDTSSLTNADSMFAGTSSLETLNLSNWDLRSYNVVNQLSAMFNGWSNVKNLILDNVKFGPTMNGFFTGMTNIENISLKDVDTSLTTEVNRAFYGLNKITELDLSDFDTSNVTNMSSAFGGMNSLKSINLSNWDFSKYNVTSLGLNLFNGTPGENLESIDMSNSKFGTNLERGFASLINVKEISLANADTSNVTTMSNMFYHAENLIKLDLTGLDTSNVRDMSNMFYYVKSITDLDVSSLDTENVTTMAYMFNYVESVENLDVTNFNVENVQAMNYMFSSMKSLKEIDLTNFHTHSLEEMDDLLSYNPELTKIDLSSFDTSNLTSMPWFLMFDDDKVTEVNLSNWDMTSFSSDCNVMGRMLGGSSYALAGGDYGIHYQVKKIIARNVIFPTTIYGMFAYIPTLEEVDLTGADTTRTVEMRDLFLGDRKLKTLDLTSFDTSNVTDMSSMFSSTTSLESVDLSSFDVSKVTKVSYMFSDTGATTGYAKDQATADFFNNIAPSTLRFTVK